MQEETKKLLGQFFRDRTAVVGLVISVLLVLIAILAPFIAPYDPIQQTISRRNRPIGTEGYVLGTDDFGRDMLSRLVWGARVSLSVGVYSVLLAMVIGVSLGVVAGYKGGVWDRLFTSVADVLMSLPGIITGLVILYLFGPGIRNLIIAVAVTMIPQFMRLARSATISVKGREYFQASVAVGCSDARIMLIHVLPNIIGQMLVMGMLWVGDAVRTEANLSFIGLGVQPPTPSWGGMVRDGLNILGTAPWISLLSGFCIFLAVIAFNMMGDGLRDVFDPKSISR